MGPILVAELHGHRDRAAPASADAAVRVSRFAWDERPTPNDLA